MLYTMFLRGTVKNTKRCAHAFITLQTYETTPYTVTVIIIYSLILSPGFHMFSRIYFLFSAYKSYLCTTNSTIQCVLHSVVYA